MLYYKDLYKLVFENYPASADTLKILSGYVGPGPILALKNLPFKSEVIFGLFKENQKQLLHDEFLKIHDEKTKILYADILCHSKCYVWLKDGQPIRGLVGSANFSAKGLESDYRETLFELDKREVHHLNAYIDIIRASAKECTEVTLSPPAKKVSAQQKRDAAYQYIEGTAVMSLFQSRDGKMPARSGVNWGRSPRSNVRPNDAYIAITTNHIRRHPDLFKPATVLPPEVRTKANDAEVVELVWDDGKVMQARFEGSRKVDGVEHRKQISTFPHKDIIGKYLRKRLGVKEDETVTLADIQRYGRDNIHLSKLEEGVYYADFSV